MRYDPAGNLIRDEYTNSTNPTREFLFDSGGRIGITRDSAGTELARYIYDPDGARVRRIINGTETWMVYGLGGELVAEYANNVAAGSPVKEYGYRGGELLLVTNNGLHQLSSGSAQPRHARQRTEQHRFSLCARWLVTPCRIVTDYLSACFK